VTGAAGLGSAGVLSPPTATTAASGTARRDATARTTRFISEALEVRKSHSLHVILFMTQDNTT
jgi:hypothetical protein